MKEEFIYALTIKERIEAFKNRNIDIYDSPEILEDKWFNVNSLLTRELFNEKLILNDIKVEEFAGIIKKYSDYEKGVLEEYLNSQEWYIKYCEIIQNYNKSNTIISEVVNMQLVRPFISYIDKEIKKIKLNDISITPSAIENCIGQIELQLSKITWKSMIFEMESYKESNIFNGETPNERYLSFIRGKYSTVKGIEGFYSKYPVLARIITQKTQEFINFYIGLLDNIDNNFGQISKKLNLNSNMIYNLSFSEGDTHNHGKSTTFITFSEEVKVVYKPRDAKIMLAYNKLLKYINKKLPNNKLWINLIYSDENFSVEEFINYEGCNSEEEVCSYYHRLGKLIAIMSILNGTDIHCENLIAYKEYPIIVDYETLFSQTSGDKIQAREVEIDFKGKEFMNPKATGLLPMIAFDNNTEKKGIDIGGISAVGGVEMPEKILIPKAVFTDEMHFAYEICHLQVNNNIPLLRNERALYTKYKEYIYKGYDDIIDFCGSKKDEIIELLNRSFKRIKVRQILKATAIYASLLGYCDHPSYLRDMVYMERLLDNSYAYPHKNKKVVVYEIASMLSLEIPIFYNVTTSNDLLAIDNGKINDFYKESSLHVVLKRFCSINKESINREKVKIRVLLGDFDKEKMKYNTPHIFSLRLKTEKEIELTIMEICNDLGNEILNNSLHTENNLTLWRHIDIYKSETEVGFTEKGLYCGNIGILFFLHFVSQYVNDLSGVYSREIENIIDNCNKLSIEIGETAYGDSASVIYFNLIIENYDKVKSFLIEFKNSVRKKKGSILSDWMTVGSYVKLLYKIYQLGLCKNEVIEILEILTPKIIKCIKSSGNITSIGFAHGHIGMIYILYLIKDILENNFNSEIGFLCQQINDRLIGNDYMQNMSWCHGVSGLGIGALACKKMEYREEYDYFIKKAVTQLKMDKNDSMCLCHGTCSEIEFMLALGVNINEKSEMALLLRKRVEKIISFYKENSMFFVNHVPKYRDFGLLTGESGVGYTLLRVLYKGKVPSVLLLE